MGSVQRRRRRPRRRRNATRTRSPIDDEPLGQTTRCRAPPSRPAAAAAGQHAVAGPRALERKDRFPARRETALERKKTMDPFRPYPVPRAVVLAFLLLDSGVARVWGGCSGFAARGDAHIHMDSRRRNRAVPVARRRTRVLPHGHAGAPRALPRLIAARRPTRPCRRSQSPTSSMRSPRRWPDIATAPCCLSGTRKSEPAVCSTASASRLTPLLSCLFTSTV